MTRRTALLVLVVVGVLLTWGVVPGVFTVDENNYLASVLALRRGGLTVAGTENLTPSRELYWFDPTAPTLRGVATPVAPRVPPLYAPIAVPFSFLGWRGLVAINTLSLLGIAGICYVFVLRRTERPDLAGLALVTIVFGGYLLEYADALWPQLLSALLTTIAFVLAARVRDGASLWLAALAGLAAGVAAGIRYQNALLLACVGLGLAFVARRRIRALAAYAVGVCVPMLAVSWINLARLGSANPVSKGEGYVPSMQNLAGLDAFRSALVMAWARTVDYAVRPPLGGEHATYLHKDPDSGVWLILGVVKKSWLQSAPWIAVALAGCLAAWAWRSGTGDRVRRELRAISLVIFPVLAGFAVAGAHRTDGMCFNQRYFIELVPLAAVALGLALATLEIETRAVGAGAVVGALVTALLITPWGGDHWLRLRTLRWVPLAIAVLALLAWVVARREPERRRLSLSILIGVALAWSFVVHAREDVPATRNRRSARAAQAAIYDRALPRPPERIALITYWGAKNAAGMLGFDRDLVILEARADEGRTTPVLIDELLRDGRRVFLTASDFPLPVLQQVLAGRKTTSPEGRPFGLVEIAPPP